MERLCALRAVDWAPDPSLPSFAGQNPVAQLPGWVVPHMLIVPAGQLGHPMPVLVLMEVTNGYLREHLPTSVLDAVWRRNVCC